MIGWITAYFWIDCIVQVGYFFPISWEFAVETHKCAHTRTHTDTQTNLLNRLLFLDLKTILIIDWTSGRYIVDSVMGGTLVVRVWTHLLSLICMGIISQQSPSKYKKNFFFLAYEQNFFLHVLLASEMYSIFLASVLVNPSLAWACGAL